jgi:hypothetical protein
MDRRGCEFFSLFVQALFRMLNRHAHAPITRTQLPAHQVESIFTIPPIIKTDHLERRENRKLRFAGKTHARVINSNFLQNAYISIVFESNSVLACGNS